MKRIFLSLALVPAFLLAQKKEVSAAFKAAESGDIATANTQLSAAENAIGGKTYLLEPSVLEQYYFAKGVSLLKSGKTIEGATYLAKIGDLGKSAIYTGKNGKEKVYYVGKAAADASGISGLKEERFNPTTGDKLAAVVNPLLQSANNAAIDAYNAKNYSVAGDKFREAYNLLKAGGQNNMQILYNAGLSYTYAKNNARAIETYGELIDMGYTGVETTYTAREKATGNEVTLDKATWDALKKSADYSDFKTETSKNIEQDLYDMYAALLIEDEKYDQAITFIADKGLKKFPNSLRLAELQSHAYYKAGRTSEFVESLKDYVKKNPNDALSWYNLGVLQSKDPALKSEAENAFRKALELDPKMDNAYQNLSYLLMGDDEATMTEYQTLRKAGKMDQANKLLEGRRERFKTAIPVLEKWHAANPANLDAVTLLKGMYQSVQNDVKAKEMKAKEDALKAKAN